MCLFVAGLLAAASLLAADEGGGWISMFDGQTLDGWKAGDNPESWSAKDGKTWAMASTAIGVVSS